MSFKLLFFAIALVSVAMTSVGFYSAYGLIAGTTATVLAVFAVVAMAIYATRPLSEDEDPPDPFASCLLGAVARKTGTC